MKNAVRHNPLNDLSLDSPEEIEHSEVVIQDILHRLQLKHEQVDSHDLVKTVSPVDETAQGKQVKRDALNTP